MCVLYCKNYIENASKNIAFGLASAKDSCTIILGSRILTGKNYGTSDISSKRKIEGTESKKQSFHTRRFGNLEKEEKNVDSDWPVRGMRARRIRSSFTSVGGRSGTRWRPLGPVRARWGTPAARSRGSWVGQGKLFIRRRACTAWAC